MPVNVSLGSGDSKFTTKSVAQSNFDFIRSSYNTDNTRVSSLLELGGNSLEEFRTACQVNFDQIVSEMAVAVAAQGTLTVDTQPTAGDTMTVGATTYTFVAVINFDIAGEISIGTDLATAQANIVAAINGTDGVNTANASATIAAFSGNSAILTAVTAGTAGNSVATTETFTALTNIFDATSLGTTTLGEAVETITGLSAIGDGDSWFSVREILNANFTILNAII